MRNLKKILALVLALMMVLSVMVTASAATYADDATIEHKEAVEVMSYIGVLAGTGDNFEPNGTLTREQAAKIVAYLLTGCNLDATVLAAIENPFTDVVAGHWSEASIKYCYNEGIILGVGNNEFDPKSELTGYQFAKMLLVAVGICESTDFTAADWKVVTAAAAKESGLLAGLADVVLSAPLSREHAAQMAFNAAQYSAVINYGYPVYRVVNGARVGIVGYYDTLIEAAAATSVLNGAADTITGSYTYGTAKVPHKDSDLLSTKFYVDGPYTTEDSLGLLIENVWVDYYGNTIYAEYTAPVKTYTSAVSAKTIVADLGSYWLDTQRVNTTIDGSANWDVELYNNSITGQVSGTALSYQVNGSAVTPAEKLASLTGNGWETVIYADVYGNITRIVLVRYGATESVVVSNPDRNGNVNYTIDGTTYTDYSDAFLAKEANAHLSDEIYLAGAVTTGASVTYVVDAYGAAHVYPTTTVTGVLGSKNLLANTLTVDGTTYQIGAAGTQYAGYTVDPASQIFAVDQYGYIVKNNSAAPVIPTNFVYVMKYETTVAGSALIGGASNAAKALVMFTDGTYGVIDLNIYRKSNGNYYYQQPVVTGNDVVEAALGTTETAVGVGTWYGYEVEEDGTYTLMALDAANAQVHPFNGNIVSTSTTLASRYLTDATTFTGITTTGVVSTVNGLPAVGTSLSFSSNDGNDVLVVYGIGSNVVSNIYAYGSNFSAAPASNYGYAAARGETYVAGITAWTFYVGTEAKSFLIYGTQPTAGCVYELTANTGSLAGTYSITTPAADTVTDSGKEVVSVLSSTYYVADGTRYDYSPYGYAVYSIDAEGVVVEDTISIGDYVVAVMEGGYVIAVYIVDAPAV